MVNHVEHAALTGAEQGGDVADELFWRVDRDVLHRLVELAVNLLGHDLRLTNGELESFAAHLLDQDSQLEFASTLDFPGVGTLGVEDLDRHVADEFLVETVPNHAGRQHLAFGAGQG